MEKDILPEKEIQLKLRLSQVIFILVFLEAELRVHKEDDVIGRLLRGLILRINNQLKDR